MHVVGYHHLCTRRSREKKQMEQSPLQMLCQVRNACEIVHRGMTRLYKCCASIATNAVPTFIQRARHRSTPRSCPQARSTPSRRAARRCRRAARAPRELAALAERALERRVPEPVDQKKVLNSQSLREVYFGRWYTYASCGRKEPKSKMSAGTLSSTSPRQSKIRKNLEAV